MTAPLVSLAGGDVRGARIDAGAGVDAFLGIPYAAAPIGERRWAPPAPAAPWTGERDARTAAPVCPQPARPFSEWAHGPLPATDEDSLCVNVWRPAGEGLRPVLVFLHGGGWAIGWGSGALLDGRHLAAALDAVVVTLNYRLGSLGWLAHPALAPAGAGAPQANWGLLDQLAALRWVAANVAAFGGDPARVTLAGESAGAGNVLHLLGCPGASGLFARAAAFSPPLHELVIGTDTAGRWAAALVSELGLGESVGDALGRLRSLPAQLVVDAQEQLLAGPFRGTRGGALPVVDPVSLPADPASVPGERPQIPLLIGSNADEGTFFFRAGGRRVDPDAERLAEMVARVAHTSQPAALIAAAGERLAARAGRGADAGGGEPSANDVLCEVVTEAWFAGPIARYAEARAAVPGAADVHRYRIEHRSPDPDGLGALHTISVPLLFGSWREGGVAARLAGDDECTAAVTAALQADLRAFVHGDPLSWPALGAATAAIGPGVADVTGAGRPTAEVVYGGDAGARAVRVAVD